MTAISKSTHMIRMAARRARQRARNARGSHFTPIYYGFKSASSRKMMMGMHPKDTYLKLFVSGISTPMLVHPTKGKRRVTEYERQER